MDPVCVTNSGRTVMELKQQLHKMQIALKDGSHTAFIQTKSSFHITIKQTAYIDAQNGQVKKIRGYRGFALTHEKSMTQNGKIS